MSVGVGNRRRSPELTARVYRKSDTLPQKSNDCDPEADTKLCLPRRRNGRRDAHELGPVRRQKHKMGNIVAKHIFLKQQNQAALILGVGVDFAIVSRIGFHGDPKGEQLLQSKLAGVYSLCKSRNAASSMPNRSRRAMSRPEVDAKGRIAGARTWKNLDHANRKAQKKPR